MRFVCISDTHNYHDWLDIPEGDFLLISGDISQKGTMQELIAFNRWLDSVPFTKEEIILIAGNHDWLFETSPGVARSLMTNCIYLQDESYELKGVKFYGSPWQPTFCNWAFNLTRGSKVLHNKWERIPLDTDVLLTHGPPHKILDKTRRKVYAGCKGLAKSVFKVNPALHLFGHIHEARGSVEKKGIHFVNASVSNFGYYGDPLDPIVIDLPLEESIA